jgi:hypothetical protein
VSEEGNNFRSAAVRKKNMISFVKTLLSSPLESVRRKVLSSTTWAYSPKRKEAHT